MVFEKIRKELCDLSGTRAEDTLVLKNIDPTDYADPLFGVGSATSAGPTLPAGSIHPSPETLELDCGGYLRNQPIVGFGHAYTSGAGGGKCYDNKAIANVARELGDEEEYQKFEKRSANWLDVWNEKNESEGFFWFPANT